MSSIDIAIGAFVGLILGLVVVIALACVVRGRDA
jgi:hypothetical protein